MYLIDIVFDKYFLYLLAIIILVVLATTIYLLYSQNKTIKDEINKQKMLDLNKEEKISVNNDSSALKPEINTEMEDLQSLTRELEAIPKEHNINMTPYELEQEEKAIISYEELVKENNENTDAKIDISLRNKNVLDDETTYTHEEEYLQELKNLNKILN